MSLDICNKIKMLYPNKKNKKMKEITNTLEKIRSAIWGTKSLWEWEIRIITWP